MDKKTERMREQMLRRVGLNREVDAFFLSFLVAEGHEELKELLEKRCEIQRRIDWHLLREAEMLLEELKVQRQDG